MQEGPKCQRKGSDFKTDRETQAKQEETEGTEGGGRDEQKETKETKVAQSGWRCSLSTSCSVASVISCSNESGGFLLIEAQLGFHGVANFELLDLAGDGLGKGIDEPDITGDFVVGQIAAAEVADFVGGG